MREDLKKWIIDHNINLKQLSPDTELFYTIKDVGRFFLVNENEEGKIINTPYLDLIIPDGQEDMFEEFECQYYLFNFDGLFYYRGVKEDIQFNLFYYLGEAKTKLDKPFCHLGVHGGYEILNG